MRFALLLVSLLLIGGCVRSINPVLMDEQVGEYPQLAGSWVTSENESRFDLAADGKTFKANYVDEDGKTGQFVVRIGKVGELTVAECGPGELPGADKLSPVYAIHVVPTYSFFVVTQTQPQLRGRTLKLEWLRSYVGEHPDELPMAGHGDSAIVIATTDQLQAFIQKHWGNKDAWTDEVAYSRPDAAKPK
jgi:hypothetical protein